MKLKNCIAGLLCSLLVMLFSINVSFAQQKFVEPSLQTKSIASVQEAYEAWKQQVTSRDNTLHSVMAVKVATVSDKEATLDLLVGGDMTGYRVKITPVKLNLDQSKEEAGVWAETKSDSILTRDTSTTFQITTEISSKANALEVEFTPETTQKEKLSFSLVVPLNNTSYASVMGSTVSRAALTAAKCFTVTLNCGNGCSVSRMCKYCSDSSQRYSGNCTSCTITCSCGACGIQE